MGRPLKIAWTGPVGEGGVPGMGTLMLAGLLDLGHQVDMYLPGTQAQIPELLGGKNGLRVACYDSGWRWNRWYSRHSAIAFLSACPARMWAHTRLSVMLLLEHRRRPYDCVFQLSQPELLLLGLLRPWVPPTVVHPCSHAAGELRWHRRESRYARSLEPIWLHAGARGMLTLRSKLQKRSFRHPDLIVGPSERFLALVSQDYGVPPDRLRLLRHPVSLHTISPTRRDRAPNRRLELLYVSRISCRKGVELIVSLSHRLVDLAGQVHITIVGGHTGWSDYRAALVDLNEDIATYYGIRPTEDVLARYRTGDALLVPSRYEPGSLVIGEALASGIPVVASDEVGPSEVVSQRCMRKFASGDVDALEREVRRLLPELRNRFAELSECSRKEAERWFAPNLIVCRLESVLREAAALNPVVRERSLPLKAATARRRR